MISPREKIILIDTDPEDLANLFTETERAGYEVLPFESTERGLDAARENPPDLLILGASFAPAVCREVLTALKGSAATRDFPVLALVAGGAGERAAALDSGASGVLSLPWDPGELLAHIRARLRGKRAADQLREKAQIAEEGQQIAHTAFEALAVTEKMTKDAFSLERALKIGVTAVFIIASVMAGIFFLYSHNAQKDIQRANAIIARLEGGLLRQQDLMAQARRLRAQAGPSSLDASPEKKEELEKQASQLRAQMATANSDEVAALQKQLASTNARLKRVEEEGRSAQNIISSGVASVCLLHVAVAFRHKASGQRLRYAGINPQGEPLQDSEGNPILTLEGRAPEVRVDVFGTAFLAGANGLAITNRHVAQPWWKDEEMTSLTGQGIQPEISSIAAYFPGDQRAFPAEIQQISSQTDLATIRVSVIGLSRPVLSLDSRKEAAVSGQPVVLMGYATGLAAILARADEDTAQQIIAHSGGDVSQVLNELARRDLIHPLITQGHIGDVLADKIVFDAQTTSGGSGGPLLNQEGKVIGVTYAVLQGFGGSNFGIPIRFSEPLLGR